MSKTAALGSPFSLGLHVRSCGKAEVGRGLGNGNLLPETFRLARPNITKHLTARIRSEAEVHKIVLNFRNVL